MNPPPEHATRRESDRGHALQESRMDRDRALAALHALEAASGTAGPGREPEWREAVAAALEQLSAAIAEQQASYAHPDSLMAQVAQDTPSLRTWVRQLHHRWTGHAAATRDLAADLRGSESTGSRSIGDVREPTAVSLLSHSGSQTSSPGNGRFQTWSVGVTPTTNATTTKARPMAMRMRRSDGTATTAGSTTACGPGDRARHRRRDRQAPRRARPDHQASRRHCTRRRQEPQYLSQAAGVTGGPHLSRCVRITGSSGVAAQTGARCAVAG
jgi:hypothetical protein